MRRSDKTFGSGRRSAFTLIEIMTVIAIITILAALIFPVFSRAQEASRKIVCVSNQQQWGHAYSMYVADYDEAYSKGGGQVIGEGWAGSMWPYVKNLAIARCPDDQTLPMTHDGVTAYPLSYALNESIASGNIANNGGAPWKLAQLAAFTAPASTVLLLEVSGVSATIDRTPETRQASQQLSAIAGTCGPLDGRFEPSFVSQDFHFLAQNPLYATGWNYGADKSANESLHLGLSIIFGPARHGDGANYLMADGHVKWFPPDAVSYGGSNSDVNAGESLPTGGPFRNNYCGLAAGTGALAGSHKQVTMSVK